MTEQPQEKADKAEKAPAPGAALVPAATPKDPRERAAELEAELAQVRADLVPGPKVRLRVAPPHDSFTVGAVTVTAEPTDVPAHALARLTSAADEAGVKIEEV